MSTSLESFQHRRSYSEPQLEGRDRYIVSLLDGWLGETVRSCLRGLPAGAAVLDVGCGEQPLRLLIESLGCTYVGLDVVQNSAGSVDILAGIDRPLPSPWPGRQACYPVVLCTEVLEHLADPVRAFANLRALSAPQGCLVLTAPFAYPIHMEPFDYFRFTPYAFERLAAESGFAVERIDRLGHPLDLVCTFLADLSILPSRPSLPSRLGARAARTVQRGLLRILASPRLRRSLRINGNSHLSNAMVCRAV